MVYVEDLKSSDRKVVWVRVPPAAHLRGFGPHFFTTYEYLPCLYSGDTHALLALY